MTGDTSFLKRLIGGKVLKLQLSGFGKHPAVSEHLSDLGQSSRNLAELFRVFYLQGLDAALQKEWDQLPPEAQFEFDHWLIWVRPPNIILGRILALVRRDQQYRFPFVIAAEVSDCPLYPALERLSPALEKFARTCSDLPAKSDLQIAFESQRAALTGVLEGAVDSSENLQVRQADRELFISKLGTGFETLALARILYKLDSASTHGRPNGTKASKARFEEIALRLPSVPCQMAATVSLWDEFVANLIGPEVSRLYLVPANEGWLDMALGDLAIRSFVGLRCNLQSLALETEVLHAITPEQEAQADTILSAWREGALHLVTSRSP